MRTTTIVLVTIGVIATLAPAPTIAQPEPVKEIQRVEPPMWWQGFNNTELQLLVYGPGVAELEPTVDYPGVTLENVVRVDSPNYLFVYLNIDPTAAPGNFDLTFAAEDVSLSYRYTLAQKNPDPDHARGFSAEDAIYLITPDRFANGNLENDNDEALGDSVDRHDPGGRHGGDLAGISQHLDYVADMGFTAIWLNPVLENAMPSFSYHGYATTDFYRVDPRYGSNEDYRDLVREAKAKGLGVIMDMIVNHSGSGHWWMEDLPARNWINFPDEYVQTSHQRTTWQDPYASEFDAVHFSDGWFVETMPDLNQRNPLLADYLIQNALWWIEYLGLAGIRMDTYPYPDKHFMTEWTRRVMDEYPAFNVVGEEWSVNPAIVSYWQRGKDNHDGYVSYLPSLMDFPLREALAEALVAEEREWGSSWEPLYVMLANDFLYPDPNSLVIFPDNHDMSRIFTQVGEDDALFRMAIAYVLTMRGVPQLYYGTEIQMTNRGTTDHGVIRSDFPGGWQGDRVNAFTGEGLNGQQQAAQEFTRRLLNWRKDKDVIHSGRVMHFNPIKSVYAFFRYDDLDTIMVIMNKSEEPVRLEAARFEEMLGDANRAVDVISGRYYNVERALNLEPRSVLVLELLH